MKTTSVTFSTDEKINLLSNFSTMLSSSIPILDVVNTLLEDSKGNLKFFLTTLKVDLIAGNRINTTFAKFPRSFDRVVVNLIRGAEESGTLETTLRDIKNNIQKEAEFSDKIKSAMMYPMIIFTVFTGVILMILIVVIPKISVVFTRLRVPLPLPTKILIFLSDLLIHQYLYLIFGLTVFAIIATFLYKEKRSFFTKLIVSLPLISGLSKKIDLTRFARNLFLLLTSGLPISTALEFSQDVVANQQIKNLIRNSREMLTSGKQFSTGLKNNKNAIPSMMIKLIEVGEKSGTLEKSMQDISDYMDYQVSKDLKTITALIEPIMLICVSIAVGGMMISIIGPIYGLISQVGGRR
ncbi:MAG: type II secretion system F family protein [Candidatus Shapirobacteria bacterium]|jgi:type II secretory pathway component PulF